MTAVADLVLNNGATTPVSHTFTHVQVGEKLVIYRDSDYNKYGGVDPHVFAGRPSITLGNRPIQNGSGNYKATLRVRIPVIFDGFDANDEKVAYTLSANADVVVPANATSEQVDDLYAFLVNALADTQVSSAFKQQLLPH